MDVNTRFDLAGATRALHMHTNSPTLERVGVDSVEIQGLAGQSAFSDNGRFLAFTAQLQPAKYDWQGKGPGDGRYDVFLMDRSNGAITNLHQGLDGKAANASARHEGVSVSADGRYVAFASTATNLVEGQGHKYGDIYLHDRVAGTTVRVSEGANAPCHHPVLSSDGRFLSFQSEASNLVPGGRGGMNDLYVRDLQTGATERASQTSEGLPGQGWVQEHSMSADGRHLVFTFTGRGLDPTMKVKSDPFGGMDPITTQVYVHDRETGQTRLVSKNADGEAADGECVAPCISRDGQRVVFNARASNLHPAGEGAAIYEVSQDGPAVCLSQEDGKRVSGSDPCLSADGNWAGWSANGEIVLQNRAGERLSVARPDISNPLRWNRCIQPVVCGAGKSVAFAVAEENRDQFSGMTSHLYTFDFARWERALEWEGDQRPAAQGVSFNGPNEVLVGGVRLKKRSLPSTQAGA